MYIVSMTDIEPKARGVFDVDGFILQLRIPSLGNVRGDGTVRKKEEVATKLSGIGIRQGELKKAGRLRDALRTLGKHYPSQQGQIGNYIKSKVKRGDEDYGDFLGLFEEE